MHAAALLVAALFGQGADTLTPDGPATLYNDWHGPHTLEGLPPAVLTGFKVTVAPGGRAGTVRLRARNSDRAYEAAPVRLPAEPGTYTFPAPHIPYDYRFVSLGLDQEAGGHAIAAQTRCDPGGADVCDAQSVDVYRPVLGDGVLPDRGLAEVLRGRRLTIDAVSEPDLDLDRAGDRTEDRTNLRATLTTERIAGRRLAVDVTIENAGPRAADRPRLQITFWPGIGLGRWERPCARTTEIFEPPYEDDDRGQACRLTPLAVGERRTLRLVIADPGRVELSADVEAEGPDLAPGDERFYTTLRRARPPLVLETDPRTRRAVRVKLRASRAGTVRVRVATGARTLVERRVRFRRAGVRNLTLRVPARQWSRVAFGSRMLTLTARSRTASTRAEVQASY